MKRLELDLKRQSRKLKLENEFIISKTRKRKIRRTMKKINTIKGGSLTNKLTAKKRKILLITAIRIRNLIEQLGNFLEKHEANILLKRVNIYLHYILHKSNIYVSYVIFNAGEKCLLTMSVSLTSAFIRNWFTSAGILSLSISGIPLFILFYRSILSQLIYNKNYQQLKQGIYIILNKSRLPYQIQSWYVKNLNFINEMEYILDRKNVDINQLNLKYPIQSFVPSENITMKQLIQNQLENELGLLPNPNSNELKSIISGRYKKNLLKNRKKIMLYSDFINHIKDETNHNNSIENTIKQFYKIKIRD